MLRALALLGAVVSVFGLLGSLPERAGAAGAESWPATAPSEDLSGVAVPDAPGVPLDPFAALLECVSDQEFQKGKKSKTRSGAKQAPRHFEVDLARASSMAPPAADETPASSVRLVAYPSRAPPRCC